MSGGRTGNLPLVRGQAIHGRLQGNTHTSRLSVCTRGRGPTTTFKSACVA